MANQANKKPAGPKVTLGQYKGLAVTRHFRPVSDYTVEHEMVHQTRTHARYIPSDQPAKRGSRVMLDFEGFMDGEAIPDSKMTHVTVLLGTGKLMPAAEQAVYGHCAGESFTFDFTYPEDFRVPELSGLTAQFRIDLHTVAERQIPELDAEFAKSLGFDSLDAMRESIREKKTETHNKNADRKASTELLEQAGANLTVDLSTAQLDKTADLEMKKLEARLAKSNISIDTYCKNNHTTPKQLRANYRATAENKIRCVLAAQAISEAEGIVVLRSEVDAEYHRLSVAHDTPEEEIRKVLTPDTVAAAVATQKVQAFLLENANVTTVIDPPTRSKKADDNEEAGPQEV